MPKGKIGAAAKAVAEDVAKGMEDATAATAKRVADKTWDLVHDRREQDAVKRRVVECHEALARLRHSG